MVIVVQLEEPPSTCVRTGYGEVTSITSCSAYVARKAERRAARNRSTLDAMAAIDQD